MARTQGYVPDVIPMEPPRFWTKPSESLRTIGKLTRLLLWPYGLFYIGLSVVVWNYFTPSMARMQRFEIGWVAEIYVRNLVMVAVWVSAIHFVLYVRRAQGAQYKYDGQWLSTSARRFMWRHQAWDNAFWSLASAPVFWTAWEVLLYWAYANDHIPHVRWSDGAGWVVYLVVMTVFSFWLVAGYFYVTHRFLHTRPMYRWAHYLHHKNVNTGPWTGLSMHPIEHLLYFSTPVFFLLIPANPFIIIVTQILHRSGSVARPLQLRPDRRGRRPHPPGRRLLPRPAPQVLRVQLRHPGDPRRRLGGHLARRLPRGPRAHESPPGGGRPPHRDGIARRLPRCRHVATNLVVTSSRLVVVRRSGDTTAGLGWAGRRPPCRR